MSFVNEGRMSDSSYIESIWHGQAGPDCFAICPADGGWNMLILSKDGKVQVIIEGPRTKASIESHAEGVEWLLIKFKPGTLIPSIPARNFVDGKVILPNTRKSAFWLNSSTWEIPELENVETFVKKLVREGILVQDSVIAAVLEGRRKTLAPRTVRHHFLRTTGLTESTIRQIERARRATSLLEHGTSILDTTYQTGYADQAHLTRSLKRFMGQTPAQFVRLRLAE